MANPTTFYLGFWGKFKDFCAKAQLPIAPNTYPFKVVPQGKNICEIQLVQPIHLIEWPWRHGSSEKLHILIDGKETINSKTLRVSRSWIKVNYFGNAGKKIKPLESIHYDYQPARAGHPLFHAQVCGDLIEPTVRDESDTFRKLAFEADRIHDRLGTIRIPSAHVSFASVLSGLVADHGDPATLPGLIAQIQDDDALPKACEEKLHERIGTDGHAFRGFAWYA